MKKLINWFSQRSALISALVLLVAIPLYPKFPLMSVADTWVAIRVDDILVLAAFLAWIISQAIRGFPIRKKKIF